MILYNYVEPLNQKCMEGIIKLVGQVVDVFSEGTAYTGRRYCRFTLECDSIWQKNSEEKEYSRAAISVKRIDVPYYGAVRMSQSESDKFGFDDNMLGTDGFGADIDDIRCGHQIEVYVQWRQTEGLNGLKHKVQQHVVVINKSKCPLELKDLLNQI